jgi:hypothetical protein
MFHQRSDWRFVLGVVVMVAIVATWAASCNGGGDPGPVSPISPLQAVATATAEPEPGGVAIVWDHPVEGELGYVTYVYASEEQAPDWRLCVDVELRKDGAVLAEQVIDTGRGPAMELGSGIFAKVRWNWSQESLLSLPPEPLEEWSRVRWSAPGEEPVLGVRVRDGVVVPGDERGFIYERTVWGHGYAAYLPLVQRGE